MDIKKGDFSEKYIKWFSELTKKDISIAGGKGANLSEMYNNNFPVPPGFIITTKAFKFFIEKNNLNEKINTIIKNIDLSNTKQLQEKSLEIRRLIEEKNLPEDLIEEILEAYHILCSEKINEQAISKDAMNILKNAYEPSFVSVRSSATTEDLKEASFAGQQESFLSIKGNKDLIKYVKKCFSSLYTARAIYYRSEKGFKETKPLLAAVVQKMIDSEKSGVMFSKNPTNFNEDIIVEAVYGLGEGIVSGKICPDNYSVSRDLKVKEIKIANKKIAIIRTGSGENDIVNLNQEKSNSKVLTNGEILSLSDYALKLEKHYGQPQDIEFAIESNKIYILQSRPITTLNSLREISNEIFSNNPILVGLSASPGVATGTVKIIKDREDLSRIVKGDILVTKMTNPDMVVSMKKSHAIITDEGGITSHASIVSREMGIPCIVGTGDATIKLKEGMKITVDGTHGKVYEGEIKGIKPIEIKPIVKTNKIQLKLILDLPDFAERASKTNIKSIGLLRLEGIIAQSGKHPLFFENENKLDEYSKILEKGIEKIAMFFSSIWIRASDIRTDEFNSLKDSPEKEINPMLGFHGIRFSLKHPRILEAELNALSTIAEKYPNKNFGIMFPQIISLEEVKQAKSFFEKIKRNNIKFGIMVETPAACQIIEDICKFGIDFISFGTNDLTQYTLAVDRGNKSVQYLYNELNPAVLSQIQRVINICKRYGVKTSLCGQAGSNKDLVKFLFNNKIDSISLNADSANEISLFIKELEEQTNQSSQSNQSSNSGQSSQSNQSSNSGQSSQSNQSSNSGQSSQISQEHQRLSVENNPENYLQKIPNYKFLTKNQKRRLKKKLRKKRFKMGLQDNQIPKLPEMPDPNLKKEFEENIKKPQRISEEIKRLNRNISNLQENSTNVEPFNNLKRIEEKSEKIKQEIEEEKLEDLQKENVINNKIKIEENNLEEGEIKEENIGVYSPENKESSDNSENYSSDFD